MRLEPFVTPYNATRTVLKWSSEDTSVATVSDSGVVTGVKKGSAKITVTDSSGNIKAVCTVSVKTDSKPVTSVSLSKQALTLNTGATSSLTVSYAPKGATIKGVTWTSNNSSIARVEPGGKIIAVAAGTATISVISDSGAHIASCVVTVKVPVSAITLAESKVTLKVGETYRLYPVVSPQDATFPTVTYTSKSPAKASVTDDGLITAHKTGKATITIKADGKSASFTVTVVK
jgi:uncharacterized protein YjdB